MKRLSGTRTELVPVERAKEPGDVALALFKELAEREPSPADGPLWRRLLWEIECWRIGRRGRRFLARQKAAHAAPRRALLLK